MNFKKCLQTDNTNFTNWKSEWTQDNEIWPKRNIVSCWTRGNYCPNVLTTFFQSFINKLRNAKLFVPHLDFIKVRNAMNVVYWLQQLCILSISKFVREIYRLCIPFSLPNLPQHSAIAEDFAKGNLYFL